MEYDFILRKNKEYEILKNKLEKMLKEYKENIIEINNISVESSDFELLNSEEINEIINAISNNIDNRLINKLKTIYQKKKIKEYEILNNNTSNK